MSRRIAGWALTVLLVVFLGGLSAMGKFTEWEGKGEMMAHIGFSLPTIWWIGVVEVACALVFLFPPTAFLGAVLLTGYLGGAIATHVRLEEPYWMPLLMGVLVWVALGLRRPGVFHLAYGGTRAGGPAPDA